MIHATFTISITVCVNNFPVILMGTTNPDSREMDSFHAAMIF